MPDETIESWIRSGVDYFICKCGRTLDTKDALIMHIRDAHTSYESKTSYICDECGDNLEVAKATNETEVRIKPCTNCIECAIEDYRCNP